MGCVPQDEACYSDESPRHSVTVSAFKMTETEITQHQYYAVTGERPSYFSDCGGDCPVEQVNWNEAKAFCEEVGGRLPTEAEWEYAARTGTTTIYYCGDEASCLNSIICQNIDSTCPVGQKTANDFGLYDMLGNVWEWGEDCWHSTHDSAPGTSGVWADGDCSTRVLRGGWNNYDFRYVRASSRSRNFPDSTAYYYGFRCARANGDTSDRNAGADEDITDVDNTDRETMTFWTDSTSGLTWQNPPDENTMNWQEAMDYCTGLSLENSGWRLPTITELRSLIRGCKAIETDGSCNINVEDCLASSCRDSACDGCSNGDDSAAGCYWLSNLEGACSWYWSSSPLDNDEYRAWVVDFSGGVSHLGKVDSAIYVRCVR